MATVEIPCPRCAGHGSRTEWKPDAGICYRCRGNRYVRVDPAKLENALHMLRAKYVRLLREVRRNPDPKVRALASECLRYCVQDGQRVRATLEMIKNEA